MPNVAGAVAGGAFVPDRPAPAAAGGCASAASGIRVTPVHLTKITSLSEIGRHMVRKIAATLALAAVGLMMAPSLAFAYPAPPVTPNAWTAPATTVSSNIELASTGAGFSVETAVLIGAVQPRHKANIDVPNLAYCSAVLDVSAARP